ncbi:hypothetical protein [Ferrimonas balearica]|uniref:hypothetical protein n=1 Tax=Ferrimonas balearica TaxID=44012 RepID=UPI001F1E5659|nr:hypothetical protein [Ferrimonas balearica]MBY6018592.1 hypothetical protein [Halomonas denitrificans]MBY6096457.1 hypothetical protein [Ferrimonas balearica]
MIVSAAHSAYHWVMPKALCPADHSQDMPKQAEAIAEKADPVEAATELAVEVGKAAYLGRKLLAVV